jgi:hypothetical protein
MTVAELKELLDDFGDDFGDHLEVRVVDGNSDRNWSIDTVDTQRMPDGTTGVAIVIE